MLISIILHGTISEKIASWNALVFPKSWWLNVKFVTLICLSGLVLVFCIMAAGSIEMLVAIYQTVWHHISGDSIFWRIFIFILVYLIRLPVVQTEQGWMIEWCCTVNWKGCEWKLSWPRYHLPGHTEKNSERSVMIAGIVPKFWIHYLPDMKQVHWTFNLNILHLDVDGRVV